MSAFEKLEKEKDERRDDQNIKKIAVSERGFLQEFGQRMIKAGGVLNNGSKV
jgi:hypothetical protein